MKVVLNLRHGQLVESVNFLRLFLRIRDFLDVTCLIICFILVILKMHVSKIRHIFQDNIAYNHGIKIVSFKCMVKERTVMQQFIGLLYYKMYNVRIDIIN